MSVIVRYPIFELRLHHYLMVTLPKYGGKYEAFVDYQPLFTIKSLTAVTIWITVSFILQAALIASPMGAAATHPPPSAYCFLSIPYEVIMSILISIVTENCYADFYSKNNNTQLHVIIIFNFFLTYLTVESILQV